MWGTYFLDTCWNEVKAIAQFLGCFAFANREGKIEFRKFQKEPVIDIPAEQRFSVRLDDYLYSVRGVSYADRYGNTVSRTGNAENYAVISFSDNKYMWETNDTERAEMQYGDTLQRIANTLGELGSWVSGTVEYYGNPALDVGDMVRLNGGKYSGCSFLITHISWQFRGAQTLISSGAPESVVTTGSSGNSSVGTATSYTTINTTSNISVIELKKYTGEVFGTERFIAKTGFSSPRETWVFVDCTVILSGDGLAAASVWLNGIAQTLRPKITLHNGEFSTLHFSFTTKISGGRHQIQIGLRGQADISDIQTFLWGQEITAEAPEFTGDSDYIYITNNGSTTVTGYVGKSVFPQIPDNLGGGKTVCIEKSAFSDSEIERIYIPDGVTEIR